MTALAPVLHPIAFGASSCAAALDRSARVDAADAQALETFGEWLKSPAGGSPPN